MKRKDLLKLPVRKWNKESVYQSILVIPSGKKHDSGYALMYIIGCKNREPIEIAAQCDDIEWKINHHNDLYPPFKNDMYYPSGIIHYWSKLYDFKVGLSLSSTDITLIKR